MNLFFQIIHPDDREAFSRARQEALTGVKEMDIEFRIVLPDGIQKWIHEKGKVERNEKGEAVTFEGTIQDITISKLLKLSLEETNERYYYASKATFDAIYDWYFSHHRCRRLGCGYGFSPKQRAHLLATSRVA